MAYNQAWCSNWTAEVAAGTKKGNLWWDPTSQKCVIPGASYAPTGAHPLSTKNKALAAAAAGGGAAAALGSTSTSVLAGIQAAPGIRKWGYGGSVTAPKAQGPGGGIVLIGIGAVFLFMFTQKKRKKKR